MGVPVITNQIGIEGIDAENGIHYFYCETPKEYETIIRKIYEKEIDAEIIAQNAVKMINDNYNLEKSFEKYSKKIYDLASAAKDVKKRWSEDTPRIMTELMDVLRGIGDFSSKPSEDIVIGWITERGYHMGNVMNAFRLSVVGECKGPHMFDIAELIGKEETLARIQRAVDALK